MIRLYAAKYTLRNGASGVLHLVARHTFDAIVMAQDIFGLQLRTCSARPA